MGDWECELLEKTLKKLLVYFQFVGDIYGACAPGEEEVIKFGEFVNSIS